MKGTDYTPMVSSVVETLPLLIAQLA